MVEGFGSGSMVKGCAMSAESCSVPVEVVGRMEYRRAVGALAFNPAGRDGAPGRSDARRVARRSLAMISYAVPETAMETWRRGERRHRRHSPWPGQPERRAATRRCCRRVRKATSKAVFCIGVGRLSRPKAKAVQSWPSIWSASQFSAWRTPLSMAGWAGTGQSRERPGCRSAGESRPSGPCSVR